MNKEIQKVMQASIIIGRGKRPKMGKIVKVESLEFGQPGVNEDGEETMVIQMTKKDLEDMVKLFSK